MKRIITYFFFFIISVTVTAQAPSKRCPTCGKSPAACQYKGKHPKCSTCGKFLDKCQYRDKHAKCYTCGRVLENCQYRGNHPKCSTCGKVLENCQYSGNHPKCSTCGKVLEECKYKGNHTTGYVNGHEWIDLGLSVKWATCNVGASSPEDSGKYYAWGETRSKSINEMYYWNNYFDSLDDTGSSLRTYKIKSKTSIAPTSGHDTAHENWGGSWRMPTITELEELNNKCKWTWTTKNGKNGYVITGPNGNSIFLPAVGFKLLTDSINVNKEGLYWSNTLDTSKSDSAQSLGFNGSNHSTCGNSRCIGQSVRPVTE